MHDTGAKGIITGNEVFRTISPLVYATLLLHVGLSSYSENPIRVTPAAGIALAVLTLLFLLAVGRLASVYQALRKSHILVEFGAALAGIAVLTTSLTALPPPWAWLIALAGIFPMAVDGIASIFVTLAVALIGFGLHRFLGAPLGDWLPNFLVTLFVGALSVLLSHAMRINLSSIRQARMNERRFNAIASATRHVFVITDARYRLRYANPALRDVVGYAFEEIADQLLKTLIHPEDLRAHHDKLRRLRRTTKGVMFSRHRALHRDGRWIWLETRGYNMLHDTAINGLVFSVEDVTARQEAEIRLSEEHALLRAVLDLNPAMIYAKDLEGRFTISNTSFQRRFGYRSEDELRGKTSYEIFLRQAPEGRELDAYETADRIHAQDMKVMRGGRPMEDLEAQGVLESDMRRWFRTNKYPLHNASGETVGVLGISRDITDRKEYETRLEHLALHDPLTGLPNRRYLFKALGQAIAAMARQEVKLAILFCDLDFFKAVNDTYGHDAGDKCLLELTRRMNAVLSEDDLIARFGGDEFVAVLPNEHATQAVAKAESLLQSLSAPILIDDIAVKIQVSIGIAHLAPGHRTPSDLIRDADAAMYQAKESGRNRLEVFDAALQDVHTRRAQIEIALRFALERGELAVVYQPKVSIDDGTIKGFELLMRWDSPQFGAVSPGEFIPIAEKSGVIAQIGLWSLEQACRQLVAWQARHDAARGVTVAVNVSMRQLFQTSFLDDVTDVMLRTGVAPESIELELTETSVMANPVQTIENLGRLKQLGLRLALDDFGIGYSSLAYLQKLPIDVLKIDQLFVRGLGSSHSDTAIVRLIATLAKTLDLEVVAEGVENIGHITELRKMGCHLAQGYAFSPALSADGAEALLAAGHAYPFPSTSPRPLNARNVSAPA